MEIRVEQDGTVAVVMVHGDIDAASAAQLRQRFDELLDSGAQHFVIDLSNVAFMDSSGLATLVQLFKRVRIGQGDVRLCGLQPEVRHLFELTRLDRVFEIFPSCQEAIASYN